jgi:hypothetical protein
MRARCTIQKKPLHSKEEQVVPCPRWSPPGIHGCTDKMLTESNQGGGSNFGREVRLRRHHGTLLLLIIQTTGLFGGQKMKVF